MEGWLAMGILLLIKKCHYCKILKEVLKIFQLLPRIYFKICYSPPMCSDLGNFSACYYHVLHKFVIALKLKFYNHSIYIFICIICAYIPNNELSFVIYMKLVQSMGSQRTRQFECPPPFIKGGLTSSNLTI